MAVQELTADDFSIGDLVNYLGVEAFVSGYTFDPISYEIDGITLDQGVVHSDDDDKGQELVVRPDNFRYLKKI